MVNKILPHFISKETFFKSYPALVYGTAGEYFVITTPDKKICSLALKTFPNAYNLLKRYQKHF